MVKKRKSKFIVGVSLVLGLTLALQFMITGGERSYASNNLKTMRVVFPESTLRNQSKVIDIPNVKNVSIKSVNNGSADARISSPGKVTIDVRNGSGRNVQTGGTYTPAESKHVTNQSSSSYNSGGFRGNLSKYLHSGAYTPGDSKVVSRQGTIHITSNRYMYEDGNSRETSYSLNDTINYNEGGYSGILTATANVTLELYETMTRELKTIEVDKKQGESWTWRGSTSGTFTGTVTKPAVDTRVYRYEGTVTKPASDTRTYENRYGYDVEIEYFDNSRPEVTILSNGIKLINKDGNITITGTLVDPDVDKITISANIGNSTKTTVLQGPAISKPWTLTWEGSEVEEGKYDKVRVSADDGRGGTDLKEYVGSVTVDKTPPKVEVELISN